MPVDPHFGIYEHKAACVAHIIEHTNCSYHAAELASHRVFGEGWQFDKGVASCSVVISPDLSESGAPRITLY